MAPTLKFRTVSFIFLLTSFLNYVNGITDSEMEAMLTALRSKGYNLFGNAIVTSDIRYQVLSGTSFTFFAPTDGTLFALDMIAPAPLYVSSLRYHVVHGRLSISDLRFLHSEFTLQTLLPENPLVIHRKSSPESEIFTVNDVEIVIPGMFYSKNIAVHGLNGILDPRSRNRSTNKPNPPTMNSTAPSPQDVHGIPLKSHAPTFLPPKSHAPISLPPESPGVSPLPPASQGVSSLPPKSHDGSHLPPEYLPPFQTTSITFSPEYRDPPDPSASPPSKDSKSPFNPPVQTPPPGAANELDGFSGSMDSDPGGDYGDIESNSNPSGRCEEDLRCGRKEDDSGEREGGVQAMTPAFSWSSDGNLTDGKDL